MVLKDKDVFYPFETAQIAEAPCSNAITYISLLKIRAKSDYHLINLVICEIKKKKNPSVFIFSQIDPFIVILTSLLKVSSVAGEMSIRSCKLATILLANFCIFSTSTHHCFINQLGQVTHVSYPSLCIHPFGEEQPSRRESPNFQEVSVNSTEDSWLITTAWFLSHPQLIKSHYKIATVNKVLFCFLSLILSFKPPTVEEYS